MNFLAALPPPPPPPPEQEVPEVPFDSAGNNTSVCIAHLFKCCQNGNKCRFAHKNDRSLVIFCKEFTKTSGCKKPLCRFIHASLAEQKAFKENNKLLSSLHSRITQENITNLITQVANKQQWTAPAIPSGSACTVVDVYASNVPYGGQSSSSAQQPSPALPIDTSVPPPNMMQQYVYQQQRELPNMQNMWFPNPPLPPPMLPDSSHKRPTDPTLCQKCTFNNNSLKQCNQEVELLMKQHADLDLQYSKLEQIIKELKASTITIMREYQNPQIRSLILNHLKTGDPTDETLDIEIERASYQNPYQVVDPSKEAAIQLQLALLINDKKRKLNQFRPSE